jgi:hypothetical protein
LVVSGNSIFLDSTNDYTAALTAGIYVGGTTSLTTPVKVSGNTVTMGGSCNAKVTYANIGSNPCGIAISARRIYVDNNVVEFETADYHTGIAMLNVANSDSASFRGNDIINAFRGIVAQGDDVDDSTLIVSDNHILRIGAVDDDDTTLPTDSGCGILAGLASATDRWSYVTCNGNTLHSVGSGTGTGSDRSIIYIRCTHTTVGRIRCTVTGNTIIDTSASGYSAGGDTYKSWDIAGGAANSTYPLEGVATSLTNHNSAYTAGTDSASTP